MRQVCQSVSHCLGWRLIVILISALVVLLASSNWLALRLHRQHLVAQLEQHALDIGETILSSTRASMLENDQEDLAGIVASIGRHEGVDALRLIDTDGVVRYSSRTEEIGRVADRQQPLCLTCHGDDILPSDTPASPSCSVIYRRGAGAMSLGLPILNAPDCSTAGCHVHRPDQRVLGVLDLELTTAQLEASIEASRRQMTWLGVATVLVTAVCIGLLAWRFVHRPMHELLHAIRRAGSGDLAGRVTTPLWGEVGELATSFNEMSGRLQEAQVRLQGWNEELGERIARKTQELERTRDQMFFAEKMASLGKLAAVVAHEINNPLAGVLVYTKLVRRRLPRIGQDRDQDGSITSGLDDTLATIESETARCGDIVRNLLLFSRRGEGVTEIVDLNEVIGRALSLVRHQAELTGVDLEQRLATDLPTIEGGKQEIQQAVLALLINALEAMPDGGTLTVRTAAERGQQVSIEIEDTGPGVPEDLRVKIFEPFFSTKEEGKGTGLGLSVLYSIVNRHRGHVACKTGASGGAVFRLTLPLARTDTAASRDVGPAEAGAGSDATEVVR